MTPATSQQVARIVAPMANVEWVEVLPFHQMGEFKWKSLGLEYRLAETPTPGDAQVRCGAGDLSRRRLPRALIEPAHWRKDTSMLSFISDLIGGQPILALFLAIGLGYLVGQINILGFSLGIGAVLFVGLAIGAIAPKAQIAGPIGLIGLIMFLYGIGILYGRQFFEGLTGPGRTYNLLAFVAVIAGLLVALGLGSAFGVQIGHTLGIFAGSMTSTATLQAALDVMGNKAPSIGYSVAYPFGVIGPILCFYFLTRRVRPEFPAEAGTVPHGGDHPRAAARGRHAHWASSSGRCPTGVQVSGVRQEHRNRIPDADIVVNLATRC